MGEPTERAKTRQTEREDREAAVRRDQRVVAWAVGLALTVGILVVAPSVLPSASPAGGTADLAHGRIVAIRPAQGGAAPSGTIVYLDGPLVGSNATALLQGPGGQLDIPDFSVGDEVLVSAQKLPDGTTSIAVIDRWRLPVLEGLALFFVVLAAAVAGWRGLRAVTALALTLGLTVRILIPLLITGWNPVALAVVFGIVVTVLSFALTQGLSRTTGAAILGTTAGLAVTAVLAGLVTAAARFTAAQGSEEIVYLRQLVGARVDVSGLLLAAVIFGGLGVINDVAIGQAATVEELQRADPSLGALELYRRSMRVGIAHLGATINTLVFAYLGASLPLLVLVAVEVPGFGLLVNQEQIAVEIVRILVGVIGLTSAVPLTTAIAARWAVRRTAPRVAMP